MSLSIILPFFQIILLGHIKKLGIIDKNYKVEIKGGSETQGLIFITSE